MNLKDIRVISAFLGIPLFAAANPVQTPSPMLTPPFPSCEGFIQAIEGDTCDTLASKTPSFYEFLRLNPGLWYGQGCHSGNINPGYFYCIKALPDAAPDGKSPGSPPPAGEQSRGDKPAKPTEQPKEEKPNPPAPKPTDPPKRDCQFGDCWKSWVDVSTADEDYVFESAVKSCEKLASDPFFCTDHGKMDFPGKVMEGCDNCSDLMSGCRCLLGGGYHTYTVGYVYGEWDDVADWVPNS